MEKVKVGIVGSRFVADIHAESFARVPNCEVVAVASPNLHHAVDFAKRHDIPRALTNFRELLKIDEIDVISLALPNDLHAEVTIAAAEAGKHVICEKPLATTLQEADAMIAACETAGVQLMYAEALCFAPKYVRAKELIDQGALGDIFLVKHSEEHSGPHSPWYWDVERSGGGALMDLGCHGIALARWLLNGAAITHVTANLGTFVHGDKTQGEDHAVTVLNFDGGQMAVVESSWAKGGGLDDRAEIYGTKGHTRADLIRGNSLATYSAVGNDAAGKSGGAPAGWSHITYEDAWNSGFPQEMQYFVDCVQRDEPSFLTGSDGRNALEVIYAAYQSARIGATVRLPVKVPKNVKKPIDLWIGASAI
ncbi:MAG: Gfo/Idh/MocA family oxidoreductase [Thermomicrobiales bacterium]